MKDKFRENFEVIRGDVLRSTYGSNPWQEKNQVVTSVSWVSRIEDAKESLLRSNWDLIIVDEAHKMSAASRDKKTLAYELGEALSEMTDHYLLMTATPHKGDPGAFLSLSGAARPRCLRRREESWRRLCERHEAPFYLRRVKEALVTFPDPETGKVKTLFTKRIVQTSEFEISDENGNSTTLSRVSSKTSLSKRPRRIPRAAVPWLSRWRCFSGVLLRASMPFVAASSG